LQVLRERGDERRHSAGRLLDVVTPDAIDAGGFVLGGDQFVRRSERVVPEDSVIQGVEPEPGLALGLPVQLEPQLGEFLRDPAWPVGVFPRLPGAFSRIVRSPRGGCSTQAVLLGLLFVPASDRAPSLHGRYPASWLLRT